MFKKKCPACGSNNTVKILCKMAICEVTAKEKSELGGCCILEGNPTRHCKTCGQDFGGENVMDLLEITSLEFFLGGCFGPSNFVYIDGEENNKIIKYAKTLYGEDVDLKKSDYEKNLGSDTIFKKAYLTSEKWVEFKKKICALEIPCWKDKYYDNDIYDGTQWELIISFANGKKISKFGSNEYPPNWNKFMKIMKKYIDENID